MRPIDVRKAAGKPRIWVAVHAGCSEPTVALFEANEESVTPPKRAALARVYDELRAQHMEAR